MIFADSVGFAATHTISRILEEIPGAEVSHGSRNFDKKGHIGDSDTTLKEFLLAMRRSEANGNRAYAVHSIFPPGEGKALTKMYKGQHKVIVREPIRQIRSCFAWIVKKRLDGDEGSLAQQERCDQQFLAGSSVPSTMSNALYAFAVDRVIGYNVAALDSRCEILQMERLVSEEDYFRSAFNVPDEVELSHFSGTPVHESSHRKKVSDSGVEDPDEEAIIDLFKWKMRQDVYDIEDIAAKLSY